MELKWLGHSSFLIKAEDGTKILTDPFDETVGYETYKGYGDIITISHHHFDHDYLKEVKGTPTVIDECGIHKIGNITITGIHSFHDEVKGAKRGPNNIYVYNVDGYTLCHLGDLGYLLSPSEVQNLGDIDILFIPIGGNYTIDSKIAYELCSLIKSKIVIPMHYKTPKLTFDLDGLEDFISYMKNGEKVPSNTYIVPKNLSFENKVVLLDYK